MSESENKSVEPFSKDEGMEEDKRIHLHSTKKGLLIVGIAILLILIAIGIILFFILSKNPKLENYISAKYDVTTTNETLLFDKSYINFINVLEIDGEPVVNIINVNNFDKLGEHKIVIKFNKSLTSLNKLFYQAKNLKEVDLSGLTTSDVVTSSDMFNGCINLKQINFDYFDSSKLTNISNMFTECSSLESINLDVFKNDKLLDIYGLFKNCTKLSEINFGGFNTKM